MDRPDDLLARAQAAARRLGRSSPGERPDAVAALVRALYRRSDAGGGAAAGRRGPAAAYPPTGAEASPDERVTLGALRAELADELARLATRRDPPAKP